MTHKGTQEENGFPLAFLSVAVVRSQLVQGKDLFLAYSSGGDAIYHDGEDMPSGNLEITFKLHTGRKVQRQESG